MTCWLMTGAERAESVSHISDTLTLTLGTEHVGASVKYRDENIPSSLTLTFWAWDEMYLVEDNLGKVYTFSDGKKPTYILHNAFEFKWALGMHDF